MDAQVELSGVGRPLVGAGEVADEGLSEINPSIDVAGLQAVEPCSGYALKHECDVLHGNTLVAVCDADGYRVVDQPILRLHRAGVFWRISQEGEPFGKGFISESWAETGRA